MFKQAIHDGSHMVGSQGYGDLRGTDHYYCDYWVTKGRRAWAKSSVTTRALAQAQTRTQNSLRRIHLLQRRLSRSILETAGRPDAMRLQRHSKIRATPDATTTKTSNSEPRWEVNKIINHVVNRKDHKVSFAILWENGEYTSEAKEQIQLSRDLGVPARGVVLTNKLQHHLAGPDPKKNTTNCTQGQAITGSPVETPINLPQYDPQGAIKAAMSVVKDFAEQATWEQLLCLAILVCDFYPEPRHPLRTSPGRGATEEMELIEGLIYDIYENYLPLNGNRHCRKILFTTALATQMQLDIFHLLQDDLFRSSLQVQRKYSTTTSRLALVLQNTPTTFIVFHRSRSQQSSLCFDPVNFWYHFQNVDGDWANKHHLSRREVFHHLPGAITNNVFPNTLPDLLSYDRLRAFRFNISELVPERAPPPDQSRGVVDIGRAQDVLVYMEIDNKRATVVWNQTEKTLISAELLSKRDS
ncbi:hypothetical protein FPCIR_5649 [Fusarium pseudocircinatum]|uniref:Uncharacterized protein n=1 Tax=Fusarium pseudocircinatum TaxID=56676 RepID=A0A8H5P9Q4_9HYPO|nr:hypothetical protein FPCIR_5649 [Fusarium pseudocircinatum]